MDFIVLLFGILNAIVLLAYLGDALSKGEISALFPQTASVSAGILVIATLNETPNETSVFFVLCFALLFSILPFYYMKRNRTMFAILILTVLEFFYTSYAYGSSDPGAILYPFIQMLAIGTACGFLHRSGFRILKYEHVRASKEVEIRRDYAHFLLGIVIFLIFLVLPIYEAIYIATTFILLGYLANSALGNRRKGLLFDVLNSIERPGSIYGLGALYLGVGTALLIGFIHSLHFLLIGMAALFFADPLATIVGSSLGGIKLPYNKRKSLYGTLAFFITVAVVGYPFVGYYSVAFALVLAFVESTNIPLDDNIGISIAMIAMYIVFLIMVNRLPFYLLTRQL